MGDVKHNKIGTIFFASIFALAGLSISYAGLTDVITVYGTVNTATVEIEIESFSGTLIWKIWNCGTTPPTWPQDLTVNETNEIAIFKGDINDTTQSMIEALFTGYCEYELVSYAKGRATTASDPLNPNTGLPYDGIIEFHNLFPCIDYTADIMFHYTGTIPAKVKDIQEVWTGEYAWLPDGTYGDWFEYLEFYGQMYSSLLHGSKPLQLNDQLHYCDRIKYEVYIHIPQDNAFQNLSGTGSFYLMVQQWNDECDDQPGKVLSLPSPNLEPPVWAIFDGPPGTVYGTYFDAILSGIPIGNPPFNIWDGTWPSWCVDEYTDVGNGYVQLWDTYTTDPAFPYPDDDWDLINWMINTYHVGDHITGVGTITYGKLQFAIWQFINGGGWYGNNPVTNHIINQTIANGEGFIPQAGQDAAVLLWPIYYNDATHDDFEFRDDQITIVIVDP
jgi:hypothetical protein